MSQLEDLVQDEPTAERLARHGYNRLLLLSDAVFAIAITLAALEIKPRGEWRTTAELWRGLQLPLFAYALSFAVIAIYWVAHRDLFARLHRVDAGLTVLSLLQLLFIAVLPAVTQLLYEEGVLPAVQVYGAAVAACGYAQVLIWAWAAFRPGLMPDGSSLAYRFARLAVSLIMPVYFTWMVLVGVRSVGGLSLYGAIVASLVLALLRFGLIPRLGPRARPYAPA